MSGSKSTNSSNTAPPPEGGASTTSAQGENSLLIGSQQKQQTESASMRQGPPAPAGVAAHTEERPQRATPQVLRWADMLSDEGEPSNFRDELLSTVDTTYNKLFAVAGAIGSIKDLFVPTGTRLVLPVLYSNFEILAKRLDLDLQETGSALNSQTCLQYLPQFFDNDGEKKATALNNIRALDQKRQEPIFRVLGVCAALNELPSVERLQKSPLALKQGLLYAVSVMYTTWQETARGAKVNDQRPLLARPDFMVNEMKEAFEKLDSMNVETGARVFSAVNLLLRRIGRQLGNRSRSAELQNVEELLGVLGSQFLLASAGQLEARYSPKESRVERTLKEGAIFDRKTGFFGPDAYEKVKTSTAVRPILALDFAPVDSTERDLIAAVNESLSKAKSAARSGLLDSAAGRGADLSKGHSLLKNGYARIFSGLAGILSSLKRRKDRVRASAAAFMTTPEGKEVVKVNTKATSQIPPSVWLAEEEKIRGDAPFWEATHNELDKAIKTFFQFSMERPLVRSDLELTEEQIKFLFFSRD